MSAAGSVLPAPALGDEARAFKQVFPATDEAADVVVDLDRPLDPHERASLERSLSVSSNGGVGHWFGRGYLHGFGPGPRWAARVAEGVGVREAVPTRG